MSHEASFTIFPSFSILKQNRRTVDKKQLKQGRLTAYPRRSRAAIHAQQVRLVSVKAERPYHPSRSHARQGVVVVVVVGGGGGWWGVVVVGGGSAGGGGGSSTTMTTRT